MQLQPHDVLPLLIVVSLYFFISMQYARCVRKKTIYQQGWCGSSSVINSVGLTRFVARVVSLFFCVRKPHTDCSELKVVSHPLDFYSRKTVGGIYEAENAT